MKIISSLLLTSLLTLPLMSVASDVDSEKVTAAKKELRASIVKVQNQLDSLVDQGGKYVYLQLAKKNGLSPFAVGVGPNEEVYVLEVPKTEVKVSISDKVLKLRQMLKLGADNNKFIAAALFVQANVPFEGTNVNGVAIEMEHKGGISMLRFSPYRIERASKNIAFLSPVDEQKPVVFFKDALQNKNNKS